MIHTQDAVLDKCCAMRCYSPQASGRFVYTQLSHDAKNYLIDSSITLSYDIEEQYISSPTLLLQQGNVYVNTLNISNNKCISAALAIFEPTVSRNCSIIFSSISRNTISSEDKSIVGKLTFIGQISEELCTHEIISSNIVQNKAEDKFSILFQISENIHLKECCALDNTFNIYFQFYSFMKVTISVIITNCTIEREDIMKTKGSDDKSATGSVITNGNKWKANPSFINPIKFTVDGKYCQASYDAVGDLTPDIKIPIQTPNETPSLTTSSKTYHHILYDYIEDDDRSRSLLAFLEYTFIVCSLNSHPEKDFSIK